VYRDEFLGSRGIFGTVQKLEITRSSRSVVFRRLQVFDDLRHVGVIFRKGNTVKNTRRAFETTTNGDSRGFDPADGGECERAVVSKRRGRRTVSWEL